MHKIGFALLLLLGLAARTDGEDALLGVGAAADAALAYVAKPDPEALARLAHADDPDPWLVADELLARGQGDAALAFAKAAPRPDTERLPTYVEGRRGAGDERLLREVNAAAAADLGAGRPDQALLRLGSVSSESASVPAWRAHDLRAQALAALGRYDDARQTAQALADAVHPAGWLAQGALALMSAGLWAHENADARRAASAWGQALDIHLARGDELSAAHTLENLGLALRQSADGAGAAASYGKAAARFEALQLPDDAARALTEQGSILAQEGRTAQARPPLERALSLLAGADSVARRGPVLLNLGRVLDRLGETERALAMLAEAHERFAAAGEHASAVDALLAAGATLQRRGEHGQARAAFVQARTLAGAQGCARAEAAAWAYLGAMEAALGDHPKALGLLGQALRAFEAQQDTAAQAATLVEMAQLRSRLADYTEAARLLERAQRLNEAGGHRAGLADVSMALGMLHHALGDDVRAQDLLLQALGQHEALGDPAGSARAHLNLGVVLDTLGHAAEARASYDQAGKLFAATGDARGRAGALGNLADLLVRQSELAEAERCLEQSQTILRAHKDRLGVLANQLTLGELLLARKDAALALDELERARGEARRLGALDALVWTHMLIAKARLALGRADLALETTHGALQYLHEPARNQGETQAASTRARFAELYATGLEAAVAVGDVRSAVDWLEAGRAGALLEALGGAEALQAAALTPALRAARADAHATYTAAYRHYLRQLESGTAADRQQARMRLDEAHAEVARAADRVMRESKAEARVLYQQVAPLEEIQTWLGPGEALIDVGRAGTEAVAVVIEPSTARLVRLAPWSVLEDACRALSLHDATVDAEPALAVLRTRLLEPLALSSGVTRILLSPEGSLAYVPLAALLPAREVAYVPSGTTLGEILAARDLRGSQVLAVADPDYRGSSDAKAVQLLARGRRLRSLPGSRTEALAVGDRHLLGPEATVAQLVATLAEQPRWRALHLACHGIVDREHPSLSSLALTASEDDDGFLTAMEVCQLRVRADLAVLSACETGRGTLVPGEGLLGLTRAFMLAGAPRVLCSLWKVDDEATSALMVKLYELWNPKPVAGQPAGPKGLPLAEALQRAQAHVRAQPKWAHPYFWAAWVIWGLPD